MKPFKDKLLYIYLPYSKMTNKKIYDLCDRANRWKMYDVENKKLDKLVTEYYELVENSMCIHFYRKNKVQYNSDRIKAIYLYEKIQEMTIELMIKL